MNPANEEIIEKFLKKKCTPCEGGIPPVPPEKAAQLAGGLKEWRLSADGRSLLAEYAMKNFDTAICLINEIADLAEQEDHHPDFHLTAYRKLAVELSTHAIGGLSENDFILAAKIEKLPKELKAS